MVAVALSPNARALIQSGRNAHRPTTADRRRVGAALRARLGSTVLPAETPVRDLLVSAFWQLPSGSALGLCLFGGILFLALRPPLVLGSTLPAPGQPPAFASATVTVASSAVGASEQPAPTAPEAASPVAVTGASDARSSTVIDTAQQSADPLGREVLLLSRAMSQLHSGWTAEALSVLEEHQLHFPNGALSQERCAMMARALCKLKRFREGRMELARLPPGSLAYERALKFCGSPPSASGR